MTLLSARGLTFTYPGASRPAFGPLDLEVEAGEIVLLLGPSGCGKSTLALCVNGLIPHHTDGDLKGDLTVCGLDPRRSPMAELSRQVGWMSQDPESQLCALTLADEVAFGPENLLVPPDELPGRIDRALAWAGLPLPIETSTTALSGGQKQRLAMAATLSLEPRLLVLDEPTAHLDPAGAHAFFTRLDSLRQETGIGILLIEHRVEEAAPLADRAVVMDDAGRLRHFGPPREVFAALTGEEAIWLPEMTPHPSLRATLSLKGRGTNPSPPISPVSGEGLKVQLDTSVPSPLEGEGGAKRRVRGVPFEGEGNPDSDLLLRVEGAAYRYPDGAPALHSADLTLRRGEIHALVGPNGSGKSTLAALVAGLVRPAAGRIERSGGAARVGYVFQNPEHQFVTHAVEDEVAYGLRRQGLSEAEIQRRVAAILERFGLEAYALRHPFRLSGGQKRRLSVAAMLVEEPDLLALDEPTFGQDRRTTRALVEELLRLNGEGLTLLLITHDMRLVAGTAHRVTALKEGRTRFTGPPHELFAAGSLLAELSLMPPSSTPSVGEGPHPEEERG